MFLGGSSVDSTICFSSKKVITAWCQSMESYKLELSNVTFITTFLSEHPLYKDSSNFYPMFILRVTYVVILWHVKLWSWNCVLVLMWTVVAHALCVAEEICISLPTLFCVFFSWQKQTIPNSYENILTEMVRI